MRFAPLSLASFVTSPSTLALAGALRVAGCTPPHADTRHPSETTTRPESASGATAPSTASRTTPRAASSSTPRPEAPPTPPGSTAPASTGSAVSPGASAGRDILERGIPAHQQDLFEDYRRTPPPAVQADLDDIERSFDKLTPVARLPDSLSVNDLLRLVPERVIDHDQLRGQLRAPGNQGDEGPVFMGYLDANDTWSVFWINLHGLNSLLLVVDPNEKVRHHKLIEERATILLRDVLDSDSAPKGTDPDNPMKEIIISVIRGMSMCCHPLDWEIHRVTPSGRLSEVLSYPKSHTTVGPGLLYDFVNRFEFPDAQRVLVHSIFPEPDESRDEASPDAHTEPHATDAPSRTNAPLEFVYQRSQGRYVPTRDTKQRLDAEAKRRKAEERMYDGTK